MNLTGMVLWVLIGALVGWLSSKLMDPRRTNGLLIDLAAGIIGAVVGGVAFFAFGTLDRAALEIWSLVVAFASAVIMLEAAHLFEHNRSVR